MSAQMNMPKLRFPEFSGEWEEKKLGEIGRFSKGKGISKSDIIENGINECIRYGELYTRYGEIISQIYSRTNIDVKNLVLSEENDVIIPASGEKQIDIATASCVLKSGVALGGDLNIIKTKNNGVFLSYYLNNTKKVEIANLAQGVSVVHLYSSQLATLNLNLPSIPEQSKIATFLTSIDAKIDQLTKKQTLLKQYKKGVMQKLFSQELRFKADNGSEFSDWEEKKLREITEINPSSKALPESFIYIDLESVDNGELRKENTVYKSEAPSRAQRVLKINDVLFQTVRPYQMNNLYFDRIGDYVASTGYAQLRTKHSPMFLFQYLHFQKFVDKVIERCTGTSYPSINSTDLSNIAISFPTPPEQQKIADFLTAIDRKIYLATEQLDATKQFKKALLQQMFV